MTILEVIGIVLGVLVTLAFIGYLVLKKYTLNQYELSLEELKNELTLRQNELEQERMNLRSAYQIQGEERMQIDQQRQFITNVFQQNQQIVKKNQVYLYGIKEEMLATINDYRKVCKLMGKMMAGEEDGEKRREHLVEMNLKIIALEDRFVSNFKMTPNQYKQERKINNTDYSSN